MGDQPRRHHLVPRSFLAGFTLPKTPEQLWVIDTKRIKHFPANIRDLTTDKDFYRITPVEGGDPFAIEKLLGEIETKAIPIIRRIDETGLMPTGEDREHLMMFLALLRVRVRFFRSQLDGFLVDIHKHMLGMTMATRERWEGAVAQVRGTEPAHDPDYETFKKVLEEDGLSIEINRNVLIKSMFDAVHALFPLLMRRHWIVNQTDKRDGPWFACTDEPMTLAWIDEKAHGMWPPGFGLRETIVTVPLTRSTLIQGWMPGDIKGELNEVRPADPLHVAFFNHRVISLAGDQIYAPTKDVLWLGTGRKFMGAQNILDLFQAKAARDGQK